MSSISDVLLDNFVLVLLIIAVFLHVLGIYLLIAIRNRRSIQDVIIMSFSITEIFMACFDVTENIMSRWCHKLDKNMNLVTITSCSLFVIPNFLILIVLTLNRFFEVYLNIKYEIYFDKRKIRYMLMGCWGSGIAVGCVLIPLRILDHQIGYIIFKYMFPIIQGVVLLIAIPVYIYIYNRIKENHRSIPQPRIAGQSPPPAIKRKKFFLPFLIILSFFLFVVIPDITNLLLFYVYETGVHWHAQVLYIFYTCGYTCDALLYIFLQKHLRERCKRELQRCCCCFCCQRETGLRTKSRMARKPDVVVSSHVNASYQADKVL